MTDTERLQQIKEREQAASSGSWSVGVFKELILTNSFGNSQFSTSDSIFIAHARSDIPWLVEQLEQNAGYIQQLKEGLSASDAAFFRERNKVKKLREAITRWMDERRAKGYMMRDETEAAVIKVMAETEAPTS